MIDTATEERILKLYADRKTQKQIAEIVGVATSTVHKCVKRGRPRTAKEREQIMSAVVNRERRQAPKKPEILKVALNAETSHRKLSCGHVALPVVGTSPQICLACYLRQKGGVSSWRGPVKKERSAVPN